MRSVYEVAAIARSALVTGIWNNFLKLGMPVLALALLALEGGLTPARLLAAAVGIGVLIAAILYVLISDQIIWVVMVILVTLMGTDHPPTDDDQVPLGFGRRLIGYASLTIPIFCMPPGISQSLQ